MATPTITPISQVSSITLSATGSHARVAGNLPFGIYVNDSNFLSGAVDQVSFTYKMLGGDVLDIELTDSNVYAAYEASVLEYSYLVNIHQSKNSLSSLMGNTTGTFDQDGELKTGQLSSSLNGRRMELGYPSFDIGYIRKVSTKAGEDAGVGGNLQHYSASINLIDLIQEYDVQAAVEAAASGSMWEGKLNGKKITIRKVFYKSPRAMWRFYGSYGGGVAGFGGMNSIGNFGSYGQYSNDSTFEVIPTWQNKLQAMAYEDSMYTRVSHYSYEIQNNILKIYPAPRSLEIDKKLWVTFTISNETGFETGQGMNGINGSGNSTSSTGVGGINNMNTLPFANVPYENINSIGKQWIRRYALAVSKEMLGQIRSKFSVVPIPGESITLNGEALLGQAKEEQDKLKEELKTILAETTYLELAKQTSELEELTNKVLSQVPMSIFVG